MKVLYIHQYFITPEEPGGTRSYWVAKELVNAGHEVVMITSTNNFHTAPCRTIIDGINVIYVKNRYSNYFTPFQRIRSFVKFMYLSIKEAMRENNVDIVYATSTPLTIGGIALWLKFKKGWKYIFEVRDLWPEFPIQIGVIKNPFIIWLLHKLEKEIYKKAEHIVTLSPGMRDGVLKNGVSMDMVSVIPNMSKPDVFFPHIPSKEIIEQFELDVNKFNIVHFGSMGVANGLEYVIETAKLMKIQHINDVNFIFLGDGAILPILKSKVKEYKLSNVRFLGNYKMNVVAEIVNCCNMSVISFKNLPILYTNSPNKLFDSLSAGKPIIVNSAGWTKDLVEKGKCGFYVSPDIPQDFVNKIVMIKNDQKVLHEWGNNARALSEKVFDKSILSKQIVVLIEKYVHKSLK